MEKQTYVCPNCGANTTNAQNCEYCGSLLVRFVEKGIDLSHTSYLNNDAVFPGLITQLKYNLKLQDEHPKEEVCTSIMWVEPQDHEAYDGIAIIPDDAGDGTLGKGLMILCNFPRYADDDIPECKEFNKTVDDQLAKFKKLDSFPLFTSEYGSYVDEDGIEHLKRQYWISFGVDAEGAARLISEIMIKVKGLALTDDCDILTNLGDDNLKARRVWAKAHGFEVDSADDGSANDGCAGVLLIGLILTGAATVALL